MSDDAGLGVALEFEGFRGDAMHNPWPPYYQIIIAKCISRRGIPERLFSLLLSGFDTPQEYLGIEEHRAALESWALDPSP